MALPGRDVICTRLRQVFSLALALLTCLALVPNLGPALPNSASAAPPAFAPPGITPAPPIIYRFIDTPGSDYRTLHPEYGPIGTLQFVTWEDINPGPGVFNWGPIDNLLNKEANLKVTLTDGRVIAKPLVLRVDVFLAQYHLSNPSYRFWDCTPQWVYRQMGDRPAIGGRLLGHVLTCGSDKACIPAYDSQTWRDAHATMVRALGARYANDPRVAAVIITTGIDGEVIPIKDSGCNWNELLNTQAGDVPYRFRQWVLSSMSLYREAFPNKNAYVMIAPGMMRKEAADYAAKLTPPVGIMNCGLDIDIDSWQGYGTFIGMWDMFETYSNTLPIWVESRYGLGNAESRYWSWVAALHVHPDGMDVHPEYLTQSDPAWLAFVQEHLGKTIQTTPDVWTVLRDSEYPTYLWNTTTGAGISGKVGDWDYWLYRQENAPGNQTVRVWRKDLPSAAQAAVYSRQARRTDQATGNTYMSFNIDDRYPFAGQPPIVPSPTGGARGVGYRIGLKLLNTGTDTFSIEYRNWAGQIVSRTFRKGSELGPVDQWVDISFTADDAYMANGMPGGADLRLSCNGDGDETVHIVQVAGAWGAPPPPPPPPATALPTATPTRVPTANIPDPAAGQILLRNDAVNPGLVIDTYTDAWAPSANYGGSNEIVVRNGDIRTGLVQFPTPALPPGTTLTKATLRLYNTGSSNPNPLRVEAYQVLRPWNELQASYQIARTGSPWGQPGLGDTAGDRAATSLSSASVSGINTWTELDVTSAVRAWLQSPDSNAGLALRGTSEVSVEYRFASSQASDVALRPQLLITYSKASGGAGTPVPTCTTTSTRTATATALPPTPTPLPPTATPTRTATSSPAPTKAASSVSRVLQQGQNGYAGASDTSIDFWSPSVSYGIDATLRVRQGDIKSSLLRFDLSDLPAGIGLRSAKLRLYIGYRSNSIPMRLEGYALAHTWSPLQATWIQAAQSIPWQSAGGNGVPADRQGTPAFSVPLGVPDTWVEADLTQAVQAWLRDPGGNYGLVLKGSGNASVEYQLCSSRWWSAAQRPQLVLTWDQ